MIFCKLLINIFCQQNSGRQRSNCVYHRRKFAPYPEDMNSARLPRILGAIIYDTLIVFAIIFVAAQWFPLLPEQYQTHIAIKLLKQIYVLGIAFLYFGYSWRRGGQTIGMKSWRIQVQNSGKDIEENTQPGWKQCLIRYLVAIISWLPAGLGFIWTLFDAKHRSWHDIASSTRLVVLPKK